MNSIVEHSELDEIVPEPVEQDVSYEEHIEQDNLDEEHIEQDNLDEEHIKQDNVQTSKIYPKYIECLNMVYFHERNATNSYIIFMRGLISSKIHELDTKKYYVFSIVDTKKEMGKDSGIFFHVVHYGGLPYQSSKFEKPNWKVRIPIPNFMGLFKFICEEVTQLYGYYLYDISDSNKSHQMLLKLSHKQLFGPLLWHKYNTSGEIV